MIRRQALVTRLLHERRLGELLEPAVSPGKRAADILIRDENKNLPKGISPDLSHYAQALWLAPVEWFERICAYLLDGSRRLNAKEIYLEARRQGKRWSGKPDIPKGEFQWRNL